MFAISLLLALGVSSYRLQSSLSTIVGRNAAKVNEFCHWYAEIRLAMATPAVVITSASLWIPSISLSLLWGAAASLCFGLWGTFVIWLASDADFMCLIGMVIAVVGVYIEHVRVTS